MAHATEEQKHYSELGDSEQMRVWGAWHTIASEVFGDAAKAESLGDMLKDVGLKDVKPDQQREEFIKLLFG